MRKFVYSILMFVCAAATIDAQGPSAPPALSPKPLNAEFRKVLTDSSEALSTIRANHFAGDRISPEQLTTRSMDNLLQSLDPHSNYLDAKATENFKSLMRAQFLGIGSALFELRDAKGEVVGTFIREAFKGGPSAAAGLRFGDEIVAIDGLPMKSKGFDEVRSHLIGTRGTKVVVVVHRNGNNVSTEIIRDAIPTPSIPDAYMIRPGVGYIAMNQNLTRTTHDELTAALAKLRSAGMRSLILDIRDNGGGMARQACLAVSEFIPAGDRIFSEEGRTLDATDGCISSNRTADINTPIVAITSKFTASSAEFLAAGLQDTDRAYFVGEGTFGKGLLQQAIDLENGASLHLTTARFVTAAGRRPQRDYSDGSLYRYFQAARGVYDAVVPSKGSGYKTRTGRMVYSGGGIKPDEIVWPAVIPPAVQRWRARLDSPTFVFIREVVAGRVPEFENYRISGPVIFAHELEDGEFRITDALFQAFRSFTVEQYKLDAGRIDAEREFVERRLRTELIVAAYGSTSAQRIANESDIQLRQAVELLPQAKQLLKMFLTERQKIRE